MIEAITNKDTIRKLLEEIKEATPTEISNILKLQLSTIQKELTKGYRNGIFSRVSKRNFKHGQPTFVYSLI